MAQPDKPAKGSNLDPARLKAIRSMVPLLWLSLALLVGMFVLVLPGASIAMVLTFCLVLALNLFALIYARKKGKAGGSSS